MQNITIKNSDKTVSHIVLAELTGKRQDNVKRTIETLSNQCVISKPQIEDGIKSKNGVIPKILNINERDSYVVVAQLCPEYTAKLVDFWMRHKNEAPKLPQTFAEALQLAADQAKQLELQAPKVAFVDKLVERTTEMNSTQIAQKFGKSAIWLNKQLDELEVFNKNIKRGRAFKQWFVDDGYGVMKQTEQGYSQALFTPAGELWIHEKLTSEGVL